MDDSRFKKGTSIRKQPVQLFNGEMGGYWIEGV
jgi:hypothetical protein